jgi:hypothetical protein
MSQQQPSLFPTSDMGWCQLPFALQDHPDSRARHQATYTALYRLADFLTGLPRNKIGYPRKEIEFLAGLSPHPTISALRDLTQWGFIETAYRPGGITWFRLLALSRSRARSREVRATPARGSRDPTLLLQNFSETPYGAQSPNGSAPNTPSLNNSSSETSTGQWAVQLYVDEYRAQAGVDPQKAHKGVVGRRAKELEEEGRSREMIAQAIRQMVAEHKAPTVLPLIVMELELSKNGSEARSKPPQKHQPFRDHPPEVWSDPRNLIIR